jgi:hypothetical protein
MHLGPGWRGPIQILSTVPTVDWALLGSGESDKGRICGSPWTAACLQTHLSPCRQEMRMQEMRRVASQEV